MPPDDLRGEHLELDSNVGGMYKGRYTQCVATISGAYASERSDMMNVELRCRDARRMEDPVTRGDRHFFVVNVLDIPKDIPTNPNPRDQAIDRAIYKRIAKSLINDDDDGGEKNAFFVKNKGITMLATSVRKAGPDDAHRYIIEFDGDANGIADGAHTYELILANQDNIRAHNENADSGDKIEQFVEVRVLTGPRLPDLVSDIAGGLNTGVQVQAASLANLAHHFDWLKDAIKDAPFSDKIAFKQFEDGEYTVTDILCILDLFNIDDFPGDGDKFPTRAYDSANRLLAAYIPAAETRARNPDVPPHPWEKTKPLVLEILELHDLISSTGVDLYNKQGSKRGGALSWVRGKVQRKTKDGTAWIDRTYKFTFLGTTAKTALYRGALMPMLGAFRCVIEEDPDTGYYRWKIPFRDVKATWNDLGGTLMEKTQASSEDLGRKPDAVGKSRNHWGVLYSTVTAHFLRNKVKSMEKQLALR